MVRRSENFAGQRKVPHQLSPHVQEVPADNNYRKQKMHKYTSLRDNKVPEFRSSKSPDMVDDREYIQTTQANTAMSNENFRNLDEFT
jgi:hypothetical protein